jgi:enhancer of polycomb-like protein
MNGYPPIPNGSSYPRHMNTGPNGLSMQQMQNLKSAFAGVPPGQDLNGVPVNNQRLPSSWTPNGGHFNLPVGAGANMNMKLPSARWNGSSPQRPPSALSSMDAGASGAVSGSMSPSPRLGHSVPMRTPSANGGLRGVPVGQLIPGMSPHGQHSPSMIQAQIHSSSPRPPQTPNISMASPSSQHLQTVGVGKGGYS